jgi:hypothetical protein
MTGLGTRPPSPRLRRATSRDVVRAVEARPDLQERARAVTGGDEARIFALVR